MDDIEVIKEEELETKTNGTVESPDSAISNDDAETSHEKLRRYEDSDSSDAQSLGGGRARVRRTFWNRYEDAVGRYLKDMRSEINVSAFI